MKPGKCCDDRGIFTEHILNGPVLLFSRFCVLFNSMLRHEYVPSHFKTGFIVPIVKDSQGNVSSPDNYMGSPFHQSFQNFWKMYCSLYLGLF
jgi:hypothetical protein